MAAALVSPIVDIISRLWTCCARHTRYLCKLQKNKDLLRNAMNELKEAKDDVQRRVDEEEADPNEPKRRTEQVRGWLERVQIIEGVVEKTLQKADAQLSKARCLGGCCPPNNCWSNYKVGKSTAKKIPLVNNLEGNRKFGDVTYKLLLCKLQENKDSLSNAMNELKEARDDVQRRVVEEEADPNEPKRRTEQVRGWLERVQIIEGEVEEILQKANEQLSRTRCPGGCCPPPNNCCSNYKLGKSIAKKIPLVNELKGKGDFQERTFVARPTSYVCKLQDNKILLKNAMDELKNVRNDVQRKVVEAEADQSEPKMRTDQVRGWLQSVEIIEGEVELILQTAGEQLSSARDHKKDKLVVMKKASVDELKEKGHFQEVTYRLPPPSVQDMNLEPTVGMESMFDKVWRLITTKDDKVVRIMGLHGYGGVGKTTLLQKINNEFSKISEHDHVVIFVVVSKPINYEAIQNKIGERLRLSLQGDERRRANEIFNVLRYKKFVILLDDLWGRVDLQRIGIPSPLTQCNSSKVIFTTRNEEVCGDMEATHKFQVECLPWDKAWRLFQDKVGNETLYSHPGIPELAELVAKECGGLPLALITIGRAMSTTMSIEAWKDAITTLKNSASEFPGMSDEVFSRLKLSYDYLRNDTIKSCFLYCALYPEDHGIRIPRLIDCWIAEGVLNRSENNLDGARNYGHHVIETLKRACLLESCEVEIFVKMHDIIRDLALWIVNDCKSSSSSTTGKFLVASNVRERWRNAERIFWMIDDGDDDNGSEEPPTSPNLRTLLLQHRFNFNNSNFSLPQSFFQFTPFIRVLDMYGIRLAELPTSICQLSDLQYLNLSNTKIKELPIELRKLIKLKFLGLMCTFQLEKIPPGVIANLSELQCLNLYDSGFKDWELKEEDGGLSFRELKKLQEVGITIDTSLAFEKLLCNQNLRKICTSLYLKKCVNLKSISFPLSTSTIISEGLGNLTSLKLLSINFCYELEELTLSNEAGESNRWWYKNKLEELALVGLPRLNNIVWGEKYHHYTTAAQQQQLYLHYASPFENLYSIHIGSCEALKDLTWVVYLENLKKFSVSFCKGLETIIELGDDDGGLEGAGGGGDQMFNTVGRVFGRLKILTFFELPKLKSIYRNALAFPSIQTISIFECPELKKLPLDSRSNVNNTLQVIKGTTKWWNELQWEDKTTESKFLPYHYDQPDQEFQFQFQEEEDLDDFEDPENSDFEEDQENSGDFEEDPENSGDFEGQTLLRGHDEPLSKKKKKGHDEPSFVLDLDLTFHIGIDGGPSSKRKKKQARMR